MPYIKLVICFSAISNLKQEHVQIGKSGRDSEASLNSRTLTELGSSSFSADPNYTEFDVIRNTRLTHPLIQRDNIIEIDFGGF